MSHHFTILVGSVLGASEYVADALSDTLKARQHEVSIQLDPDFEAIDKGSTWIICTSTHGAGDLPDNIQPFAAQLQGQDLSSVNAYIIGLGDSSYDTFCHGAMTMEKLLTSGNATILAEPFHIDVLNHPIPEDEAVAWLDRTVTG